MHAKPESCNVIAQNALSHGNVKYFLNGVNSKLFIVKLGP